MSEHERSLLELAGQRVAEGQLEEAAKLYRQVLARSPDSLEALRGLGRASELMERWTEAHDAFARALTVQPDDPDLAAARAECLRQAGCLHQAVRAYAEALRLDAGHLFALAGRGEALRLLGQSERALAAFEQALAVDETHAFALRGRAACLSALGRYVDAIPSWELALSLLPRSSFVEQGLREARQVLARGERESGWGEGVAPPELPEGDALRSLERVGWARALIRDGRLPEAVEAYRQAARLDPARVDVRVELARAHEAVSSADTALAGWEEVLALEPAHPEASAGFAHGMRRARRYVEALSAYDRALERAPVAGALRDASVVGRAETLRLLGRWNDALGWFARALDRSPTHLGALKGQAQTLDALGRHAEAESLWRRALAINATDGELRQGLERTLEALRSTEEQGRRARAREAFTTGKERLKAGRPSEALAALQTATALQPAWAAAHYLLGLCHAEAGSWAAAGRAFGQVLLHEPDHIDASWRHADALRMAGQLTPSLQAFDAALQRDPDDVRLIAGRADTLRQLSHHRQAIEGFDRALVDRPRLPLAVVGKASSLNALARFDEAHGLWLMALQDHPSVPAVKQGLEACRRGLRDGRNGESVDGEPMLPVRAAPTGLVPVHRHEPAVDMQDTRLPLVPLRSDGRADFELGRRLYKQRRFAEAADCFRRFLEANPLDAEAALRLGMSLEDARRYGDAIRAYRLCLSIDPGHCQAATNIGEALRKREQYREAVDAYDEALALRDDYLYALAGRAECMRMLGQLEESLAWFDKALAVGHRHAFAVQGKAASLNALGRFAEALPLWERALEIESSSTFAAEGKAVCERHLDGAPQVVEGEAASDAEEEEGTPTLDEQARDLTALARAGQLSPVIGRQTEIRQVMKTLVRRLKANPLLLGEPGVGKTAVVEGVAQRLIAADAPPKLQGLRILELSMGSILAGTKYRGTFEERLRTLIDEATRTPDVVLFIDEIHTLVGAGRTEGGALDAANILKPALARGEISVIGATTIDEYRKHFEQDSALERRFQPIRVDEPTIEETETLLDGMLPLYAEHHGVVIGPEVVARCVQLAVRFMPERRLPDKALDVLDEACADASLDGETVVDAERVARVVSERTGVPVHTLTSQERDRLRELEGELSNRVVGQDAAVAELAASVRLARSGLRDELRPRGVFLFAGGSGVGKTDLARALADFLFPEGDALIKLDMSEYAERFTGSRLLGAPPGYQGHGEEGQLTGPLRNRPYSVVLLDEFEKAHPDVQAMFLSLFDDGVVTDSEGRRVQAREAFFVLTTNAGSEGGTRGAMGFGAGSPRDMALERVRDHFRPELFNRIDGVVVFRRLEAQSLERIVEHHLERLAVRAAGAGVTVSWAPEVVAAVALHKPDPGLGARPALRALEELVAEPLGARMLAADGPTRLHAVWRHGAVAFEEGVAGGPQPHQDVAEPHSDDLPDEPVS